MALQRQFQQSSVEREALISGIEDARQRTLELISDLNDAQLIGPKLAIVNPLLWEAGHVAWFQEHWVLRHALGHDLLHANADALYDSSAVAHDTRWNLPLLSRSATVNYLMEVRDRVVNALRASRLTGEREYFVRLSIAHEDMHDEAFLITRQTLAYPTPRGIPQARSLNGVTLGDAQAAGGKFLIGAVQGDEPFIHDNEKWANPVNLAPFSISKCAVTQSEFAEFVSAGGYRNPNYWSEEGWRWREDNGAEHPVYWRRTSQGWEQRLFDQWKPLEATLPVIHVNWYEAQAYCRFVGRRLPTESEWEYAASYSGTDNAPRRRRFPWGDAAPSPERANLDAPGLGCVVVGALAEGDSAIGCRQMIGNVWEWTDTTFLPYPGFSADPYRDYSVPWFGTHKVLRGGCWATRSRLIRNTWRNFYTPDRRDVFAGFRTCAL